MEEEYREGGENQSIIISEQVKINGILTPLTLSADGKLRWTERGEKCLTVEKQVLGFSTEGFFIKIKAFLERETGVYCGVGGAGIRGIRLRKDFVFEPISEESKTSLCQKLQECIDSYDRPKRLFIIVNPYGGKKSASKIFDEEVKPLLEAADIQYTVQETQYRLHAKEVSHTLDLTKYDGIVCVSGDGILVEVVNGLLQREDWASAIKMPLGIVSAGTGNGMVKSLLDEIDEPCSVSNAMLAIIRGHKCSLDVATVLQEKTRFFSVLMLAWGLVADIDIESEKYRWMGSARLDFYGLLRVIRLRKYNGRVSFVPAPGYETFGEKSNFHSLNQNQADDVKVVENGYLGPEICMEDLEWRSLDGPFVSVWLHNVPWGSEDTCAAPNAKFSDGYLDLIIMRDCSKSSLLTVMTKLNDGSHVKSPHVFYLKVKAFILEPGQRADDPSKGGIIDSDGEVLARGEGAYKFENKDLMTYGPLQITVDQGLATLFSPRL
ncbi:hypothetical protein MKW98_025808 [Papaver atlanticum]|uniref:sphingosine kinase n=1 Tax=Papaver atlanticum TaxID=357466 RepID=A0AAD4RUS0_9MAGN|nr:hypothetical protein MKW98_025808 [Papaver atlanticum]